MLKYKTLLSFQYNPVYLSKVLRIYNEVKNTNSPLKRSRFTVKIQNTFKQPHFKTSYSSKILLENTKQNYFGFSINFNL